MGMILFMHTDVIYYIGNCMSPRTKSPRDGHCGRRNQVPSAVNPELLKILSFKPEVGKVAALHESRAARNFASASLLLSQVRQLSFIQILVTHEVMCVIKSESV